MNVLGKTVACLPVLEIYKNTVILLLIDKVEQQTLLLDDRLLIHGS